MRPGLNEKLGAGKCSLESPFRSLTERLAICGTCALTGSNLRHVVMLAQTRQVLVQFLDALFVRLDAFLFQALIELPFR